MPRADNDNLILDLIAEGRLKVDMETGDVTAPRSNTPGKPLGSATNKGYLRTSLFREGRSQTVMVHRIVALAAWGRPPHADAQVNHRNGNKRDNRPDNLEWTDQCGNMRHAAENGLTGACGRRNAPRDVFGRFLPATPAPAGVAS